MPATILDGKAIAAKVKNQVKLQTAELRAKGIFPGLAVIIVGSNPA